jgi:hypothetical protein
MRTLRFVRSADDGTHVIVETADGGEQFSLRVDTALRDAARSDLPRLATATPAEPTISPREIQMRVRAGEAPQTLAEAHHMTLERVLRFAGPVLEERARIANEARRARARRSTTDGQTVIFGDAVDERFSAHGIDPTGVRWDARRRDDGAWIISAGWRGGDAERVAEWSLQLANRTVSPIDDTAADLLSDRPIRPALTPVTGPVRTTLSAAPPLAPGVVAFPAMQDAHTGPLPVGDEVFDQEAADLDAPRVPPPPPVVRKAPAVPSVAAAPSPPAAASPASANAAPTTAAPADPAPTPAVAGPARTLSPTRAAGPAHLATPVTQSSRARSIHPIFTPEQPVAALPLDLDLPEPDSGLAGIMNLGVAHRSEESDEEKAERARIPSWDDILLGVRRKRD